MFQTIYQFKIALTEIEPLIWRRILVPEKKLGLKSHATKE
jgi:hypothetical protein